MFNPIKKQKALCCRVCTCRRHANGSAMSRNKWLLKCLLFLQPLPLICTGKKVLY